LRSIIAARNVSKSRGACSLSPRAMPFSGLMIIPRYGTPVPFLSKPYAPNQRGFTGIYGPTWKKFSIGGMK
jgi:hypothetical protein